MNNPNKQNILEMINNQFDLLNKYKVFKNFEIVMNKNISFQNDYSAYYINNRKEGEICSISLFIKNEKGIKYHSIDLYITSFGPKWVYSLSIENEYYPEIVNVRYSIRKTYDNDNFINLSLFQRDLRIFILQYIKLYYLNKINIDKKILSRELSCVNQIRKI